MRRVISAALGGGGPVEAEAPICGVSPPLLLVVPVMGNMKPPLLAVGPELVDGESMLMSSRLMDEPRGRNPGGGGVVLLASEKVSQKRLPFAFFIACCLKLAERPRPVGSIIIASSGISSIGSWGPIWGLEWVVVGAERAGGGIRGSSSTSLSRT